MIHMVTGGSGSGKSEYAEQEILNLGEADRVYLATMFPGEDEENHRRIERHRAMRAQKDFVTLETYLHLDQAVLPPHSNVLLDCLSNLVANELFLREGAGLHTVSAVLNGLQNIIDQADNLVVVTNEVFSDGKAYDSQIRIYMEYMGAINQALAVSADRVTEVVYGIPLPVKRPEE